jgi:hypothetical protein
VRLNRVRGSDEEESNKVLERLIGEVVDSREYRTEYGERSSRWRTLVGPVLRQMGIREIRRRTGLSRSAIERSLRIHDPTIPHPANIARYRRAAAEWVGEKTESRGLNDLGVLYVFLLAQRAEGSD